MAAAPVEGLSDAERTMLIDGLQALRKERGKAWNEACDAVETPVLSGSSTNYPGYAR